MLETEKKMLFLKQQGICFLFQLRNIGEKIRRFVFGKFVKTCRELITSMLMNVQIAAEKKPKKRTADALWKVN